MIYILYVKDLLAHIGKKSNFNWNKLVRNPFFIPENKKLDDLLKEFHKNGTIIGWKNLIEKKDFFTLSKQLIEMHYDPKYKNSNNYTEKSKIQKIHLDPNIKNNVSEVANLILAKSNKI